MKCGEKFQNRLLYRRLDSKKKAYREVYLCKGEKEVLILYYRDKTPDWMCNTLNKLPLEYVWYLKFGESKRSGLPSLLEYGFNKEYVWLITQYIPMIGLIDYMNGGDYTGDNKMVFYSYLNCISNFYLINPMFFKAVIPLCITPDNIFFCLDDNGGVQSIHLTGLDTMLFPSYGNLDISDIYDVRYLAPEILSGKYSDGSISYSFALSVFSVLRGTFPLQVTKAESKNSVGDIIEDVKGHIMDINQLGLSPKVLDIFKSLICPDPTERKMFTPDLFEDLDEEDSADDQEESTNNNDYSEPALYNPSVEDNRYDNCFIRTKGHGLDDVGGMIEAKSKLKELRYMNRQPGYAERLGFQSSNVLLVGPPGTGKSFFAKKIAESLNRPYFLAHTSDLLGSFHGESAQLIRDVFLAAEKNAPCVVILDEFDGVAQIRDSSLSKGAVETTNELLTQLQESNSKGVLVIATTNSLENVDPAVTRAKRFGYKIYIGLPDDSEKELILRCVMRNIPNTLQDDDYSSLVKYMSNYVAADIAEIADQVNANSLITHGDSTVCEYLHKNINEKDAREYKKYLKTINEDISEDNFDSWCRITGRDELYNSYIEYTTKNQDVSITDKVTYEMLKLHIMNKKPSLSTQLVRSYSDKYKDFFTNKEQSRHQIGFV